MLDANPVSLRPRNLVREPSGPQKLLREPDLSHPYAVQGRPSLGRKKIRLIMSVPCYGASDAELAGGLPEGQLLWKHFEDETPLPNQPCPGRFASEKEMRIHEKEHREHQELPAKRRYKDRMRWVHITTTGAVTLVTVCTDPVSLA